MLYIEMDGRFHYFHPFHHPPSTKHQLTLVLVKSKSQLAFVGLTGLMQELWVLDHRSQQGRKLEETRKAGWVRLVTALNSMQHSEL